MAEKTYFTIQEISRKTQVPGYTLRYWESRFRLLRPLRLSSGHRRYTAKDLEIIGEVKDLVLMKGYSLAGAKKLLYSRKKTGPRQAPAAPAGGALELLEEIKKELQQIIREC